MTVKFLDSEQKFFLNLIMYTDLRNAQELDVHVACLGNLCDYTSELLSSFHFNDQLCTDFCPTVKSTSQKSARPKSALRRQKVGTVDRQDLDMTEGENLEQEFGQETVSNMIDMESISSYGLDGIVSSKCDETFFMLSAIMQVTKPCQKIKFKISHTA